MVILLTPNVLARAIKSIHEKGDFPDELLSCILLAVPD
jgi:hypothetical protein